MARKLEAKNLIRDDYDSSWVQIEGGLLAVNSTPDGYALICRPVLTGSPPA